MINYKLLYKLLALILLIVSCNHSSSKKEGLLESNNDIEESIKPIVPSTTICNICGREFNGNGYEEQLDGSITELSDKYQGFLCSPTCVRKASKKIDDVADKYGIDTDESLSSRCSQCSGHYEGDFCNLCGGASPEKVNQSTQNRANCEMCQGNKYVEGFNGMKICHVCNGSGKVSH